MGAIRGYLEVVRPFQIRGWAMDPDGLNKPVEVRATLADTELASARADMFRDDLVGIEGGDGRHGFVLNLPTELDDTGQRDVAVTASSGAASAVLSRVRSVTATTATVPAAVAPPIVAPWDREDRAHHPVFILGAARSGTSALAQGLLSSTRYRGHQEGHLLDIVPELLGTVVRHYRERGDEWSRRPTMIAAVSKEFFLDGCRHLIVEAMRKTFPEGYWIDKTPRRSMTLAAPVLRQIWPNARFVFMKRRAIENVASRLRKFPQVSFTEHCEDWSHTMRDWSATRSLLVGCAIEVDQLAVARTPGRVADAIGRLLDLRVAETDRLRSALSHDRPEQTAVGIDRVGSLDGTGWSRDWCDEFRAACGPGIDAFDYAYDESYYRGGDAAAGVRLL